MAQTLLVIHGRIAIKQIRREGESDAATIKVKIGCLPVLRASIDGVPGDSRL